jgi:cytidylate kinase
MRHEAALKQQLARWEAQSRAHRCVALSRLPGAGGEEVARLVAERLGYGVFGREILEQIAREQGVTEELLEGVDEQVRGTISRYVTDVFRERRFTESDYLRHVARAVATLAERGQAVILGRGANFVLGPERALRVLLVAPLAYRVDRIARERGLSAEDAAAAVRSEEERRAEFVRHHFGVRQDDPSGFDACLNTASLGIELTAKALVDLLHLRFPAG